MTKQILPILLTAALLSLPAQALKAEIEPQEGKTPLLVEHGLLLGTGEALELDRAPTLAEAITMTARITAGEAAIRAYAKHLESEEFWAAPYLAWAAHAGWLPTDTDYTRAVRMEEFLELLLRALGEDSGSIGVTADRLALFDSVLLSQNRDMENYTGGDLTRADMAVMAYNALGCKNADGTPLWELHSVDRPLSWMCELDIGEYRVQADNHPSEWTAEDFIKRGGACASHTAPELFEASLMVDGTEISLGAWGFSFVYDYNNPMWYSAHTARYVPLLDALDALGCGYTLSPGRIDITTEAFAPESIPLQKTAPETSLYMLAGAYSPGGGGGSIRNVTQVTEAGEELLHATAYDLPFAVTVDGEPFIEYGGRIDPGHNWHGVYRDVRKHYTFAVLDGKLYVMVDALAQSMRNVCRIEFESAAMGGPNPLMQLHMPGSGGLG